MQSHIQKFIEKRDFDAVEYKHLGYKKIFIYFCMSKIHEYQTHWVRERRDKYIIEKKKKKKKTSDNLESNIF